jgi:flavin-dependent dehydrogenase
MSSAAWPADRAPAAGRIARIRGAGVAGLTCARLLDVQGWQVALEPGAAPRPIPLLLGADTAGLLAMLWNDATILDGTHRIATRRVRWGGGDLSAQPAPGCVITAPDLTGRLAARLSRPDHSARGGEAWTIDTRRSAEPSLRFGNRHAWFAEASLTPDADPAACIMETVPGGWLFLLPTGTAIASLQLMAVPGDVPPPPAAALIAGTSAMRAAVAGAGPWSPPLPAMPAITLPLTAPAGLAAGEAALAFDPIAGDGVGHALRGAVQVATTLDAIAKGADAAAALADQERLMRRVMAHHLAACLKHYDDPALGGAWADEVAAMQAGLARLS